MTVRRSPPPAGAEAKPIESEATGGATPAQSAPLIRRLAAAAYEGLLLSAVLLLAGFLVAPAVSPTPSGPADRLLPVPQLPARIVSFAVMFGAGALYFGWSWTGGRRTLPMRTWRMRLVMRDGRGIAPATALVRYCAAWIGPALALCAYAALAPMGRPGVALWLAAFNYAWGLVDPDRAFLHDRIAGTRIVAESRRA